MIGIFVPYAIPSDFIKDTMHAFGIGLGQQHVFYDMSDGYKQCDIAVVWGAPRDKGLVEDQIKEIWNTHPPSKLIVIEKGFVHRDKYYMVGWGGLNNKANFNNNACPSDRWNLLDTELLPRRGSGKFVLVCGQKHDDASVYNINYKQWCNKTLTELQKLSKKPVMFRRHPLSSRLPERQITVKAEGIQFADKKKPLSKYFRDAHSVVAFNSNSGVEAMIAGIPTFAFDRGSMVWDVCNRDLQDINKPDFPSEAVRKQWAYNLGYTQWNKREMMLGLPQEHLGLNGE